MKILLLFVAFLGVSAQELVSQSRCSCSCSCADSMNQHVLDAQKWLGFLRDGTTQYDALIAYIREDARKGNFSLAKIGTSEKELKKLRIKGIKISAQLWLGYLRKGTTQYDEFIGYIREEIHNSKGKLSLADIGTSESELKQLQVKGSKIIPKNGLPKLACSYDDKRF